MLIFKYAQYYLNVVFLVKSLMCLTVQNPYYDMAQYFWKPMFIDVYKSMGILKFPLHWESV